MKNNNLLLLSSLTLLIVLTFVSNQFFVKRNKSSNDKVACTEEAKLCPDGSSVSRTGPKCEFTECPNKSDTYNKWKTYTDPDNTFTFQYPPEFTSEEHPSGVTILKEKTHVITVVYYPGTLEEYLKNIPCVGKNSTKEDEQKLYTTCLNTFIDNEEPTNTAGNKGLKTIWQPYKTPYVIILFENKPFVYEIKYNNNDYSGSSIEKILSTLKVNNTADKFNCESFEGRWLANYKECLDISEDKCTTIGGKFDNCASPCRHNPKADQCITMCVEICSI